MPMVTRRTLPLFRRHLCSSEDLFGLLKASMVSRRPLWSLEGLYDLRCEMQTLPRVSFFRYVTRLQSGNDCTLYGGGSFDTVETQLQNIIIIKILITHVQVWEAIMPLCRVKIFWVGSFKLAKT